jgi:hypothetical protein
MRMYVLLLAGLLSTSSLFAQTTASFEEFGLAPGAFLNGSDGSGGFQSGNVFLPNTYDQTFQFWDGWAISSVTDNSTPGFGNQYSAIAGGGAEGTSTYALTYAFSGSPLRLTDEAAGGQVEGLYVTNSTYAYFSMLEGDGFAKKFGGETGDDPDYFLLRIQAWHNGALGSETVEFYLADYRFANNSQDYLVSDWTYLDLRILGPADSLLFSLESSDVGAFGMNTPAYFCIDEVRTADGLVAAGEVPATTWQAYPNPCTDFLRIRPESSQAAVFGLFSAQGQLLRSFNSQGTELEIPMGAYPAGLYLIRPLDGRGAAVRVVKQ